MNMDFNEAVEIAKRTWYPKDHELHFNPHHPLGKLLGEWGELLDDYMKSLYKPGYVFEPEDELGYIWYYVRILAHQADIIPKAMNVQQLKPVDFLIAQAMEDLCLAIFTYHKGTKPLLGLSANLSYTVLLEITRRYSLTLDDLTHSNWEKLKPGSIRGDEWMKTDYVSGGKIGLKEKIQDEAKRKYHEQE